MHGENEEEGEEATESTQASMSYDQVYEFVRDMQKDQDADSASLTSESSFGGQSDIDDDDEEAAIRRRETRERWKRLAKKRRTVHDNTLQANFNANLGRIQSMLKEDIIAEDVAHSDAEDIGEHEIEELKKKTHFNRMRNKSLHVLAKMQRDPVMKENLSKKQILKQEVAKKRFKGLVTRVVMDKTDGKRKISDITDHLIAKRKTEIAVQELQNIKESPAVERHEIHVHQEDIDDPNYANIDEVKGISGEDEDKPIVPKTDDTSNSDTEVNKTPKLDIPKVENDVWPEEEHYATAQDTVDVLF